MKYKHVPTVKPISVIDKLYWEEVDKEGQRQRWFAGFWFVYLGFWPCHFLDIENTGGVIRVKIMSSILEIIHFNFLCSIQ